MKTNMLKILIVTALVTFAGAGDCVTDGWKSGGGPRGHAEDGCSNRGYHWPL